MYISLAPTARMRYTLFHHRWNKSHIHDKHLNFVFIIYNTFDRRDANLAFARVSRRRRHDVHVLFGNVRYDVRNAHSPVNNKKKLLFFSEYHKIFHLVY